MNHTDEQLKELEKKLVSDLEAVRRVMARNADPDLIRVAALLADGKPDNRERNLFETQVASSPKNKPVENKEASKVIMRFATNFKYGDVVAAVKKEYPDRQLRVFTIPAVLRKLRKAGKIKEFTPRNGRNGAVYVKV